MPLSARTIAIADDDLDDRDMTREAFAQIGKNQQISFFADGVELMDHLRRCADGTDPKARLPSMVILDLNMPRIGGLQALSMIRSDARMAHLPVVMMSTSRAPRDYQESIRLGANSFITKPARFHMLVEALRGLESLCGSETSGGAANH